MEGTMSSDEMLEELLRYSENEFIPKLKRKVARFADVFNHSKTQWKLTTWLLDYSHKLEDIQNTTDVHSMLRAIRNLVAYVQERFSPTVLLEFMQESGFFALVNDDRFKFLDEDEALDISADRLIDLIENGFRPIGQNDAQRTLEEYIETWSQNQRLMGRLEGWIESRVVEIRQDAAENATSGNTSALAIVNDIKAHFEKLRPKLVGAQVGAVGGTASLPVVGTVIGSLFGPLGTIVGGAIGTAFSAGSGAALAFSTTGRRVATRGGNWFDATAEYLVKYVLGDVTDHDVEAFIQREGLNSDFHHFQDVMNPWVRKARDRLGSMQGFIVPKAVVLKEVDRIQKFCYAVILNKPEKLQAHSAAVSDLVENASAAELNASSASVLPCVSFGQLELGNRKERVVEFRFVLPKGTDAVTNETLDRLKKLFDSVQRATIETQRGIKIVVIQAVVKQNVAAALASHIKTLSDLSVRAVLIGNMGLRSFRHAMNPQYNRIYSELGTEKALGFIPTGKFVLDRGGEPYYAPFGWRRYAIDVGKTATEFERDYGDWPVAYHGTSGHLATPILINGMMASERGVYVDDVNDKPEDRKERKGIVYLSPSIEYCGHPRYAMIWKVKNFYVQMVLQVRVKKSLIYAKEPGTIDGAFKNDAAMDPNFADNKSLEWLVKWPPKQGIRAMEGILIYGIMLRVSKEHPGTLKQNKWWQKTREFWEPK